MMKLIYAKRPYVTSLEKEMDQERASELNKTIRTFYESLLWKAFLYPAEIKEYSQCNSMN